MGTGSILTEAGMHYLKNSQNQMGGAYYLIRLVLLMLDSIEIQICDGFLGTINDPEEDCIRAIEVNPFLRLPIEGYHDVWICLVNNLDFLNH